MQSVKPGNQRKSIFSASLHKRNKLLHAHLSKELRNKYRRRSIRVRTGDNVIVIRGDSKGHEGKVVRVDAERGFVYIEGLTMKDSRGRTTLRPIHASKVIVTKLDLSDEKRRTKLEALSKVTISNVQAGEQP
ncbi:MAG: 50S ribosomal protein L24 [Thermoprotei archaeon]